MKLYRLASIFLTMALIGNPLLGSAPNLPAFADDSTTLISGTCGENGTWIFDTETRTLTISGEGRATKVSDAYAPWDSYKPYIKKIVIEEGITYINYWAFHNCSALEEILLPDSLLTIGHETFEGCYNLKSINIPENVTSIGYEAFKGCESLASINIPDSVTEIGRSAFGDTEWLEVQRQANPLVIVNRILIDGSTIADDELIIPDGVMRIGDSAFEGCANIISVKIPNSVIEIENKAFYDCNNLSDVSLPESVEVVAGDAFGNTRWYYMRENDPIVIIDGVLYSAKQAEGDIIVPDDVKVLASFCFGSNYSGADGAAVTNVTLPNGIKSISTWSFYNCRKLMSINIPDSVTSIESEAFWGCVQLSEINIPDGVTRIDYGAFWGCSSLTNVVIPKTVTTIGSLAFWGLSDIDITVLNPNCEFSNTALGGNSIPGITPTIHGYDNSTAQAYAEKYDYTFVSLGEAPTDEYEELALGDINGDSKIDASDAADLLITCAVVGAGGEDELSDAQRKAADVDSNGNVNAADATIILQYAAAIGAGQTDAKIEDFV